MIWAVLGLVPNAVALQCAFDDLVIQKATARAGAIFSGLDLMGMSFFSLLQDKTNAAVIRRMMLVNQSMADSSRSVSAWDPKFSVWGLCRVQEFCFRAQGLGFRGLGFGAWLPNMFDGSLLNRSLTPTPEKRLLIPKRFSQP